MKHTSSPVLTVVAPRQRIYNEVVEGAKNLMKHINQ